MAKNINAATEKTHTGVVCVRQSNGTRETKKTQRRTPGDTVGPFCWFEDKKRPSYYGVKDIIDPILEDREAFFAGNTQPVARVPDDLNTIGTFDPHSPTKAEKTKSEAKIYPIDSSKVTTNPNMQLQLQMAANMANVFASAMQTALKGAGMNVDMTQMMNVNPMMNQMMNNMVSELAEAIATR